MAPPSCKQIEKQLSEKVTQGDVFAYIKHEDSPKGALQAAALTYQVESAVSKTPESVAETVSQRRRTSRRFFPATVSAQRSPADPDSQLQAAAICFA